MTRPRRHALWLLALFALHAVSGHARVIAPTGAGGKDGTAVQRQPARGSSKTPAQRLEVEPDEDDQAMDANVGAAAGTQALPSGAVEGALKAAHSSSAAENVAASNGGSDSVAAQSVETTAATQSTPAGTATAGVPTASGNAPVAQPVAGKGPLTASHGNSLLHAAGSK
jgi:hypothetical protein